MTTAKQVLLILINDARRFDGGRLHLRPPAELNQMFEG